MIPRSNWVVKKAVFHVLPSVMLDPNRLDMHSRAAISQFAGRFAKEGWTLEGRPRVRELPFPQDKFDVIGGGDVNYILPSTAQGYPHDHPLREPGMIDMEIIAYFSKRPEKVRLQIPDKYIEKHGVPSGFTLKD